MQNVDVVATTWHSKVHNDQVTVSFPTTDPVLG
jgi:hypothetical protein